MPSILLPEKPSDRNGAEVLVAQRTEPPPPRSDSSQDHYVGVIIFLVAAALFGAVAAVVGGVLLANAVLFDVAVTLVLATGVLIGVATAQTAIRRAPAAKNDVEIDSATPEADAETEAEVEAGAEQAAEAASVSRGRVPELASRLKALPISSRRWLKDLGPVGIVRVGTGIAGVLAIAFLLLLGLPVITPSPLALVIAAAFCLGGAGVAAIAARYLGEIDSANFPEAAGLCRGARMTAWILVLAAVSVGLEWMGLRAIIGFLYIVLLIVNAAICYALLTAAASATEAREAFPLNFGVLSLLGSRPNVLASVLDGAERQLGIDLRSTWALTVVRRTLEPLLIGLFLLGWLSTSLTVVGVQEQGLVERLGVPVGGQPLASGLHLHWPWPIDKIYRLPVQRILDQQVGHEGEESEGPENVLWAVEHAPNEYTLLLGNGRDLITVDADVQYRIKDALAWRYHSQNPADAVRAIAYRAVMRSTVDRTLSDTLSQNLVVLTGQMRQTVQRDADAMGLGIDVVGFTIGGMHPPVPVAADYEAVVSAELGKVTAVANANAFRNSTVPEAEATAIVNENTARAEGAQALGRAAGEAWSFRTLESQYRASPQEYFFRRRLEVLENNLAGRGFTVVDSRFQRDGGELWLIP